jgi:preprotein translocase SecE subunit
MAINTPSGPGKDPNKIEGVEFVVDPATPIPPLPPEKKDEPKFEKQDEKKPETKKSESTGGGGDKNKKKDKPTSSMAQFRQFMSEVLAEFRKITWPHFNQVLTETGSVLFLVTVITLMVLGFDWILSNWIFGPLEHFAKLHGGGIGS